MNPLINFPDLLGVVAAEPPLKRSRIEYLSYQDFQALLEQSRVTHSPFETLASLLTAMEGYWTCFVRLDSGVHIECQLAFDEWDSTCNGEKHNGEFKYIECYEHNPKTGISEEKQLFTIRINPSYDEGEWLWINKGNQITGRQSMAMAIEVSKAMNVTTCYLADTAKVPSKDGRKEIALSVSLQVMNGYGYYSPPFKMVDTLGKVSAVVIEGKTNLVLAQDVAVHERELNWMRELSVKVLHDQILESEEDQKEFVSIVKRNNYQVARQKKRPSIMLSKCKWTLKDLVGELYRRHRDDEKEVTDYEWVYFKFLDFTSLSAKTEIQKRYAWIAEKLYFNMYMSAQFNTK